MRISCVIPTRNRPEMTCRAIASVLAQDAPAREIIVVDDGSTDSAAALVAPRFPGVRLAGQLPLVRTARVSGRQSVDSIALSLDLKLAGQESGSAGNCRRKPWW